MCDRVVHFLDGDWPFDTAGKSSFEGMYVFPQRDEFETTFDLYEIDLVPDTQSQCLPDIPRAVVARYPQAAGAIEELVGDDELFEATGAGEPSAATQTA